MEIMVGKTIDVNKREKMSHLERGILTAVVHTFSEFNKTTTALHEWRDVEINCYTICMTTFERRKISW